MRVHVRSLMAGAALLMSLSGCESISYTYDPVYSASCSVNDLIESAPPAGGDLGDLAPGMMAPADAATPVGVPGLKSSDFRRVVYATGRNFTELEAKLHAQDAGTLAEPCSSLEITPLNPGRMAASTQPVMNMGLPAPAAPVERFEVHFAFNSTQLDARASGILRRAAASMMQAGNIEVHVSGHTDTVGAERYNQRLSQARANRVVQALEQFGVPEGIITADGVGKHDLLVPTGNGVASRANRRAVILTQ